MNFVYGYLTIGLLLTGVLFMVDAPFTSKTPLVFNARPDPEAPPAPTWRARLTGIGLILLLMLLFWPFWVGFKGWRWWMPPEQNRLAPEGFAVQATDLLEPVALADIEQRESPSALESLAWRQFRRRLRRHDTLWTFSAYWKPWIGTAEWRTGYVIVRSDRPGPCFLTRQKRLDEEAHRY